MKNRAKIIFHIDLNQFFCSCAILKNPRLKGKAFAIGRENTNRGVLATASYEARKKGIHAGMALQEALRIDPKLIIVGYPYSLYQEYSKSFFRLISEYVSNIEQASIDECYIDVTSITVDIERHPVELAKEIQSRALEELGLPCSIGIAPTLYLAKMASDMKKPLGITVLRIRDIPELLYPLSVKDIFGIGKKTYPILIENGINTIGDFVNPLNEELVRKLIGSMYDYEINCLKGKSTNIINENRKEKNDSISHSCTYDRRLVNYNEILDEILAMSEVCYRDMIHDKQVTKTVGITLRDTSFKTIQRSISIPYTKDKTIINYYLEDLLNENYDGQELRLVGVTYANLKDDVPEEIEVTLFNYQDVYKKEEAIDSILKELNDRFGKNSINYIKKLK